MINTINILDTYKSLEENGIWLTDEQTEYAGVGYRINNPLRYTREGNTVVLECHQSDLEEITSSNDPLENATMAIKQGNIVFAVFNDDRKVNFLINVMEDYLKDDEETTGEYFADYDHETELWCVFHTDIKQGHAYANYSTQEQAEAEAEKRNKG